MCAGRSGTRDEGLSHEGSEGAKPRRHVHVSALFQEPGGVGEREIREGEAVVSGMVGPVGLEVEELEVFVRRSARLRGFPARRRWAGGGPSWRSRPTSITRSGGGSMVRSSVTLAPDLRRVVTEVKELVRLDPFSRSGRRSVTGSAGSTGDAQFLDQDVDHPAQEVRVITVTLERRHDLHLPRS